MIGSSSLQNFAASIIKVLFIIQCYSHHLRININVSSLNSNQALFLYHVITLFFAAPSDETLHLLATSYYRCGSVKRAHALLQKHSPVNIHCKFLMAKCCDEMKRYDL